MKQAYFDLDYVLFLINGVYHFSLCDSHGMQ